MQVAVIGCGPAGLLAALAVEHAGHEPWIISRAVKSPMFGAMFLHRAIPDITPDDPEFEVDIVKEGSAEGYALNVYGDQDRKTSWDKLPTLLPAWDIVAAYDKLWDRYKNEIKSVVIHARDVNVILANFEGRVINSIPKHAVCLAEGRHSFDAIDINIAHGPGKRDHTHGHSYMVYNGVLGNATMPWYRYSYINGYHAWEYRDIPDWSAFGGRWEMAQGIKVVGTDCDCYDDVLHVGRFGRWQPGVLTHHAYEEALEYANAL